MGTRHSVSAIGGRLQAARLVKQWSQWQLAEKVGAKEGTICRIEIGERLPSISKFVALCTALGCSADYLLGATPPITVPGFEGERGAA
jgi:transcriptional regulator with XRE-family HTH domain